jgi:hypothetical protein
MQHSNGNTGLTQPEPGDTPEWVPTDEQPWRPVPDDDSGAPYQFDPGAAWCTDRASHPQFQDDGYPSLNHHRTECRSYDGWFGSLNEEGRPGYLSMYLVRPFRFGQERATTVDETRLAIEFDPAEDDAGPLFRCTVPASIIRNLSAHLSQTAGVADGWRPPRRVVHLDE